MTANRLVRGWLPDGPAREVVARLIDPIRLADPTGQLVSTLRTFLDHESNLSATAAVLHVHRNTAIQRMQRIRSLLEVDLDDPNDRLALRLALRV
jgi:purine catabolism regulator